MTLKHYVSSVNAFPTHCTHFEIVLPLWSFKQTHFILSATCRHHDLALTYRKWMQLFPLNSQWNKMSTHSFDSPYIEPLSPANEVMTDLDLRRPILKISRWLSWVLNRGSALKLVTHSSFQNLISLAAKCFLLVRGDQIVAMTECF